MPVLKHIYLEVKGQNTKEKFEKLKINPKNLINSKLKNKTFFIVFNIFKYFLKFFIVLFLKISIFWNYFWFFEIFYGILTFDLLIRQNFY